MGENIVKPEVVMELNVKYVNRATQKEKLRLLQKNNYLFLLANLNDWTHRYVKKIPVNNIINLEISAQNKLRKFPLMIPLKTSSPPIKMKRPNKTTICINNFFLDLETVANIEKKRIGSPSIDGIKAVNDELEVEKYIIAPHNIRNKLYIIEIDSIFSPINLYSFNIIIFN